MKKIIKKITILMAPLIVIAMAIFGSLKSYSNIPNKSSAYVQSSKIMQKKSANQNLVGTPEELFVTYPLSWKKDKATGNVTWPVFLTDRLSETKNIGGDSIYKRVANTMDDAIKDMLFFNTTGNGGTSKSQIFTEQDAMLPVNNTINGISSISKDKTIVIKAPKHIWDPIMWQKDNVENDRPKPGTSIEIKINDFAYKVATIDTTKVGDGKDVMFDIYGNGKPQTTLVFKNDSKQLSENKNNLSIEDMENLGDIYFRKTEPVGKPEEENKNINDAYDQEHPTKNIISPPKGIELFQDSTKHTIDIYVKPGSQTINFGINKMTKSKAAIKFGLLDQTYSPKHMKATGEASKVDGGGSIASTTLTQGELDGKNPLIPANAISLDGLTVHHRASLWKTVKNYDGAGGKIPTAEVLTLYMSEGAEVKKQIFFAGEGSSAFEGGANIFEFKIDQGTVTKSPSSFKITQLAYFKGNGVKAISLKTTKTTVSVKGVKKVWVKVELAFTKKIINFDRRVGGTEKPFQLKTLNDNIFFEEPGDFKGGTTDPTKSLTTPVNEYIDTSKDDIKILGTIYANWWGYYKTGTDHITRPKGMPKFHVKHEGYTLEKDGSLKPTVLINKEIEPDIGISDLNKYTNQMSTWAVSKLGATAGSVRENDFYKLTTPATSGGFVKKRFIEGANSKHRNELKKVTTMARKWYIGDPLNQEEMDYKNPFLKDKHGKFGVSVKEYVVQKPSSGSSDIAKSSMFRFIEPLLFRLVSDRYEIEKATFDTKKSKLIAKDMKHYLDSQAGLTGVNNKSLKRTKINVLNKDMDLLALNGNASKHVSGGKGQLGSIVEFIKDFDLQTKYLEAADAIKFNQMVGIDKNGNYDRNNNDFIDSSIWENVGTAPQPIFDMVGLLDKIISKISGQHQKYDNIRSIIDGILSTKVKNGSEELGKLLNNVVSMITSSKGILHYDFFGRSFTSSYMQNLAVGYNLAKTVERYLNDNKSKLSKSEQEDLAKINKQTAYDTKVITRVAINNKYYNIPYFIDGMSKEGELKRTVKDLLQSDMAKNVSIELPNTNKIVDFLSDPTKLVSIGMTTVGALLTIIGGIISFIAFKNKGPNGKTTKQGIIVRVAFVGITVLGIILLTGGILLPVLAASGKLAFLAA